MPAHITPKTTNTRFWELDSLRGIAILMMVLFHTLFAIQFFSQDKIMLVNNMFWLVFARATAVLFILLAGISLHISYSRTKYTITKQAAIKHRKHSLWKKYIIRGLKLLGWAIAVSIVTWLYIGKGAVLFGILHFLGVSIILSHPFVSMRNNTTLMILGLITILLGFVIQFIIQPMLQALAISTPWLLWLGIMPTTLYTIDYFPLFPWFGVFLIGIFLGKNLYKNHKLRSRQLQKLFNKQPNLTGRTSPAGIAGISGLLCFLGRNSLKIYLLHVPIIVIIIKLFIL